MGCVGGSNGLAQRRAKQANFGDCFAYAFAKASGEPLKGGDLAHTDIVAALSAEL